MLGSVFAPPFYIICVMYTVPATPQEWTTMTDRDSKVRPPVDGSLILPGVIDFNHERNYAHPFFVWSDDNPDAEVRVVTQGEFARASHRVAHIVRPLGRGVKVEVVAIMANIDTILYIALISGIIRAGFVPFPISPRNSPAAVISVLRSSGCHRVLVSRHSVFDLITGIEKELAGDSYQVSFEDVPWLSTVYPKLANETPSDPFEPYSVNKQPPALDDICIYMHSSGSTSYPRAIPQSHRILLQWQNFPKATEVWTHDPPLCFAAYILPPFHGTGIYVHLFQPLFSVTGVSVLPPTSYENPRAAPMVPSNPAFLSHATRSKANAIVVVPSFLENWMEHKPSMEWLRSLQIVVFVGAPLSRKKGDALVAAEVTISADYGATEIGPPVQAFPRKQDLLDGDWDWVRFNPNVTPRWVPQGDGLFELQMLTTAIHQVAIENLTDVKGYATKDLFEKHPTKSGLFRFIGRLDDVIVLSAGEKVVPGPMQDLICLSPDVKFAIIFGTGYPQVGLLVEPTPGRNIDPTDKAAVEAYKDEIWSFIEKAQSTAPGFARIFREMIVITEPSRPLPLTAKGTVIRKMALDLYSKEVKEVYDSLDPNATSGISEHISPPKTWYGEDLLQWLNKQASQVQNGKVIDPRIDLFLQGFDSLSTLFLRNRISGAMRASALDAVRTSAMNVTQYILYEFPTLVQLSKVLSDMVRAPDAVQVGESQDRANAIENLVADYTKGINVRSSPAITFIPEDAVVLITGSTGSIGSFLLADLLISPLVRRVYALNRISGNESSRLRQEAAFKDRGLDVSLLQSSKCKFLETDMSQDKLGLSSTDYQELIDSVTAIIHNAWRLDFNLPVSSFAPNLKATCALINLSNVASYSPRIIFISSVASGQSWRKENGPFPETLSTDSSVAVGTGYGESKYIAERVLALSNLDSSSLRIGQVSGSTFNGAWSTTDWVPIIVKSSIRLGCLPDMQKPISWLPADNVSRIILDILFQKEALPPTLNVVHPKPVSWSYIISTIRDTLEKNNVCDKLPLVPWIDWMSKIEELGSGQIDEDLLQSLPVIKILRFLQRKDSDELSVGAPTNSDTGSYSKVESFSTDTARKTSKTLRDMAPLTSTDIERWISFWQLKGLF